MSTSLRGRFEHNRYMRKYVKERVERFEAYRSTLKCERCGFSDHRALEFHHRDPSKKEFTIGYGVRRFHWEKVQAEIAKCEVVCANCHRIEHHANLPQSAKRKAAAAELENSRLSLFETEAT